MLEKGSSFIYIVQNAHPYILMLKIVKNIGPGKNE